MSKEKPCGHFASWRLCLPTEALRRRAVNAPTLTPTPEPQISLFRQIPPLIITLSRFCRHPDEADLLLFIFDHRKDTIAPFGYRVFKSPPSEFTTSIHAVFIGGIADLKCTGGRSEVIGPAGKGGI